MRRTAKSHGSFFNWTDKRVDGVDAVDQFLVETNLGKIHGEFFLEENDDLDSIDGCEPSAEQQRRVVCEWPACLLFAKAALASTCEFLPGGPCIFLKLSD